MGRWIKPKNIGATWVLLWLASTEFHNKIFIAAVKHETCHILRMFCFLGINMISDLWRNYQSAFYIKLSVEPVVPIVSGTCSANESWNKTTCPCLQENIQKDEWTGTKYMFWNSQAQTWTQWECFFKIWKNKLMQVKPQILLSWSNLLWKE